MPVFKHKINASAAPKMEGQATADANIQKNCTTTECAGGTCI